MDVEQHQPSPCSDQCRPYTESNGRRLALQLRDIDPPKMRPFDSFFDCIPELCVLQSIASSWAVLPYHGRPGQEDGCDLK
jgi:hypothetical protein